MKITRVVLKPLRKPSKLKKFRASNCVFCSFTDNTFTITFQISNDAEKEAMQDLVIDFSNIRLPKVYLSKPFAYDNAESEEYGNEEAKAN